MARVSRVRPQVAQIDYPAHLDKMWQLAIAPRKLDAPTVISTFAGGGGSSLGYLMAGYRELLAVEWDDNAVATLRLNFPELDIYHGDIAKLTVDEVLTRTGLRPGELDILDGSPPCQGFSTAGKRRFDDDRNQLFREYVRLLRGLMPRVFVMENVSGMVKGKMKLIFADILRELRASGYRVKAAKLNAMYFHVPQSRERMIFIGVRDDLGIGPSYPGGESEPINLQQAISDNPDGLMQDSFVGRRFEVADKIRPWSDGSKVVKGMSFNLKRLSWDKPSRTILKSIGRHNSLYGGGLLHPDETRHLSIGELKRIGAYPDNYRFVGDFYTQWFRIGNSVPPLFMEAIARHIRTEILSKFDNG